MRRRIASLLIALTIVLGLAAAPAGARSTIHPYQGDYMGRSTTGHKAIVLSYSHGLVQNITADGHVLLRQGHVSGARFSTAENGRTFVGRWTDEVTLEGHYTYVEHHLKHTIHYTVHAFAF